jgi:phosphomannomutase
MVTGSHIPDDRNGIKFNMPWGEVLKQDEKSITENYIRLANQDPVDFGSFSPSGDLVGVARNQLSSTNQQAEGEYANRYLSFFAPDSFRGLRVVVYEHSSVSRDVLSSILEALGAEVVRVGRSEEFVPVDTEAVANPEEIAEWINEYKADALASTDGDGDRPLLFDEEGNQVRGDVLGILVSRFLGADSVSIPVSCNSGVEKSQFFENVYRTRIGSPFVISSMLQAVGEGWKIVVGFEANGGFLTASEIPSGDNDSVLAPLPTRDAILPIAGALRQSALRNLTLSQLVSTLPSVFTRSGLIKRFPNELGHSLIQKLETDGPDLVARFFGKAFGDLEAIDFTDGARMTFSSGEIVHLRPSGNAPEFRCYTESGSQEMADHHNNIALQIVVERIRPYLEQELHEDF